MTTGRTLTHNNHDSKQHETNDVNRKESDNEPKKVWQKIDDSKKDVFTKKLEENLSKLSLSEGSEEILQKLTMATKDNIDECFPPKLLSNNAKKRAEQPWNDKDILKEEKDQCKPFHKFVKRKKASGFQKL